MRALPLVAAAGCSPSDRPDSCNTFRQIAVPDAGSYACPCAHCDITGAVEVCGSPPLYYGTQGPCDVGTPLCPIDFCNSVTGQPSCAVLSTDGGTTVVLAMITDCTGRRPSNIAPAAASGRSALGRYAARAAHLEAASVPAFEKLKRELRFFGAPLSLVNESARAARDESRHARQMGALADRHGSAVAPVVILPEPSRSLEAIALENAVEGCTRELYGAQVAKWQAEAAADEEVRRAMRIIAEDELRHAQLGLAIAAWADSQLDDRARENVARARIFARQQLQQTLLQQSESQELIERFGLPDRAAALSIARSLS